MSRIRSPIATSTPLPKAFTGLVLKEKQVNAEGLRRKTQNDFKTKKTGMPGQQRKSLAKENAIEDEEKAAKRRQQAIEAMKIQEQRRLRMKCQEVLADELGKMTVSPASETSDDIIEMKRMEAKKLKEKRILAFIAEQELKKNKKIPEEKFSPKEPNFLSSTSFRIKTRPCLYKPRVPDNDTPLPKVLEGTVFPKFPDFNRKTSLRNQVIIRYKMDDIRAMNPYGYYFM